MGKATHTDLFFQLCCKDGIDYDQDYEQDREVWNKNGKWHGIFKTTVHLHYMIYFLDTIYPEIITC